MAFDYRKAASEARKKQQHNDSLLASGQPLKTPEDKQVKEEKAPEIKPATKKPAPSKKPIQQKETSSKSVQLKSEKELKPKMGRPSSSTEPTFQKTIRLTQKQIDYINKLVKTDKYPDMSAAVRDALDSKFKL